MNQPLFAATPSVSPEIQNELSRLLVEQSMLRASRRHLFRSLAQVSAKEVEVASRVIRLMSGRSLPDPADPCQGVPKTNMARVTEYLASGPKTIDEIAAELKRQGCSQQAVNNVRQTVYCLVKKNLLCRVGRGRWKLA